MVVSYHLFYRSTHSFFGSGAVGYSRVDDNGTYPALKLMQMDLIIDLNIPLPVSVNSENGSGASVKALVNGIKIRYTS